MGGVDFTIDSEIRDGVFIATLHGTLDDRAVSRYLEENIETLTEHPSVWDVRDCDMSSQTAEGWRQYLSRTREVVEHARGLRSAVLCGSTLQYGLLRMLEELATLTEHPVPIRPFRSLETATTWVRIRDPEPTAPNLP